MQTCQPGDLEVVMPLQGATPYSYATTHALEEVLSDGYFLACADRLKRGDTIRVTRDADGVLEVASLLVVEASRKAMRTVKESGLRVPPLEKEQAKPPARVLRRAKAGVSKTGIGKKAAEAA